MSLNIAKTLKGPCVARFKQADFFSRDDVTIDLSPSLLDIDSSAFGTIDQRIDDHLAQVQFTPLGIWSSEILAMYNGIATKSLNDFMADNWRVSDTTAANDQLTSAAHGIPDGTPVRAFSIGGSLPTGLAEATLYYTNAADANNVTLHPTEADGIAGTNTVDITADDESGDLFLIEQQPMRITSLATGEYVELHNTVVSQLAPVTFSATQQLFGQMQWRAFPKFGVDRVTADSVYSEGTEVSTASLTPSAVITQPYTFDWGSAPWDALEAKEGLTMSFQMALGEDQADSIGTGMLSLQNLTVQVQAQPAAGLTVANLLSKIKAQGSGSARGTPLSNDDLNIVGTGVYARAYNAALQNAQLVYSATNNRIPALTWQSTRTLTAGVPDPLFFLGTAAPA